MNCRSTLYTLIIVASMLLLSLPNIYAEFVQPRNMTISYNFYISHLGVAPRYIAAIDIDRLLVAGSVNNSNGVAILNVNDPYIGAVVEQVYPLTGSPTCVAVDGFPIKRIAVGSDRGEILLFNIEGGRITGYLYTVLGADFYINKVYLVEAPNSSKVIALASEGGPRTVPCTRCYVYVFDERSPGIMRIGPRTGNATTSIERVYVQDIAPLTIFDSSKIYRNASLVALTYIPAALITLEFSILYLYNNTLYPAANTLVEVLAYDKARGISYLYGVNADSRGNISIPVLMGLYANLTIRDITGRVIWSMVFDPSKHVAIDNTVTLPPVIVTAPPDTRRATRVYGTPEFLKVAIEVLDVSSAPARYTTVASANFRLDIDTEGFNFIANAREPIYTLVFGNPSRGELSLIRVAVAGKTLRRILQTVDYIGLATVPVATVTYVDGSYIHVALSDGRIRVFRITPYNYTLHYIYPMDAPIRKFLPIPTIEGYTYTAITTRGIQILTASPIQIPVIRNLTTLYGTVPNYVDSDALADLSAIFLASSNSITVVRNMVNAARERRVLTLDEIRAPTIVVKISLPGNETYEKIVVNFTYPQNTVRLKPDENGFMRIANLVPGIRYSLHISYQEPYVVPENRTIVLTSFRDEFIEVPMKYREYTVKVKVSDPLSREPIAPYNMYMDGRLVAEEVKLPEISIKAIYGSHTIAVEPAKGYEAVYEPSIQSLYVDSDKELEIQLFRKSYTLTLYIVDRVSNTSPIAPVQIRLPATGRVYTLPPGDHLEIAVLFGNMTIYVEPARGWERAYSPTATIVEVSRDTVYIVYIDRVKYGVRLNVLDGYTHSLVAPVEILVNGTTVYRGSRNTVDLVLDYGVWNLTIAPHREGAYTTYTTVLYIDSDRELMYVLNRTLYGVVLEVRDVYGSLLTPLNISISGVVNTSQVIKPPTTRTSFTLPYGVYKVYVEPVGDARKIYIPAAIDLTVKSDLLETIEIERIRYKLDIAIRDVPIGRLVGIFDLYANKSRVYSGIKGTASIEIPCGVYSIELVPQSPWDAFYEPSRPIVTPIFNDTSIIVSVNRKSFNLKVTAVEGVSPVKNAIVAIESLETGITITQLITDENGIISTKVPYGTYRVAVTHPDYYPYELVVNIASDVYEIAYLRPAIVTLVMRYLPIVLTLVGVAVAIYIILKIRAIIARRLAPEEELF
uniref:Carboxypeptidase regulatory-like domain-containing protein n=1 Tax=Ignisphaera aggregans TaxID=334771 RepID=A0A7J3I5D7_9CREN